MFFTEIFHLLLEQTNVYYQQRLDRQTGNSHRQPDITMPDMISIAALVCKDTREVYMLTNMDPPPAEGNFMTTATAS